MTELDTVDGEERFSEDIGMGLCKGGLWEPPIFLHGKVGKALLKEGERIPVGEGGDGDLEKIKTGELLSL